MTIGNSTERETLIAVTFRSLVAQCEQKLKALFKKFYSLTIRKGSYLL